MYGQTKTRLYILFLALIAVLISLPNDTLAQRETAYDLVNAVNDLRALHGLEPYTIDPWLMEYAQEHSEYQATIQSGTHQHSDGSLPQDIGLIENVAGGDEGVVTAAIVVYEIWVDWGHRHTVIGYSTGEIGAGVALSENGQVYYTVDIRHGEEVVVTPISGTAVPFDFLVTSTPNEDGSIIHIVRYGETLWSITQSYGVSVDDIRRLNGMAEDSTLIQIGQKLLIRMAHTVTPTVSGEVIGTLTETPTQFLMENLAFTITPSSAPDALLSTVGYTVSPSLMLTSSSTSPATVIDTGVVNNKTVVIILVLVVVLLLTLVILSFQRSGRGKISGESH